VQQLAELIGKNLYQLSSLNGLNFAQYEQLVLPCVAEQIVQCEDKLAQQYLMEVCTPHLLCCIPWPTVKPCDA
jgi:vacuolar protein sorting-associated protein 35